MFVCCECCVLSGRGLCDELITRPEESYRLWCVVVCDLENLRNEEAITRIGSQRHHKKKEYVLGGKGGRCVGLTTLPPSCADSLEILWASISWNPQGLFYLFTAHLTHCVSNVRNNPAMLSEAITSIYRQHYRQYVNRISCLLHHLQR
jgi:hypothetical protein